MNRLAELVHRIGFDHTLAGDEVHMVFASGAVKWQCACKMGGERVLIYSIYPFEARSERDAVSVCNRINAALTDSCLYYDPGNRRFVVRSSVSLTDGYYALELFREAVKKHCNDVLSNWDDVFCTAAGGNKEC